MAKKSKRKRPKNPLLEQKFKEGYELGVQHGIQKAVDFFIMKFEGLPDVPGIGPVTMQKIKKQLGEKYFRE